MLEPLQLFNQGVQFETKKSLMPPMNVVSRCCLRAIAFSGIER
jgi:hypothetical protein